MSDYSIGVDIGGTKLLAGVINTKTGEVIGSSKEDSINHLSEEKIIQKIISIIEKAICVAQVPLSQINSIGVGIAGQVDREEGILISAPNLNCHDVDIVQILTNHFKKPVHLGNDVEVATIGEMNFGAAIGYDNFMCVFVGTGVGSGIVNNKNIYLGATGTAGEIGHIIVDSGGRQCSCGGNGCLETYASRIAIEKKLQASIKRGHKTIITDLVKDNGSIQTSHLQKALEKGDELVLNCITEAAEYLSSGLATVVNFYNPKLIILGGALIENIGMFYDMTIKKTKAKSLPTPSNEISIQKAKLKDFSGIVGASLLSNYRK